MTLSLNSCVGMDVQRPGRTPESVKQMDREVRDAMQRIQIAAEHFAADHGSDQYPTEIDEEFKSYMPGGQEGVNAAPVGPVNVYSGVNQFCTMGKVKDVHSVRYGPRFAFNPGEISYCPLQNGKGYAIIGGSGDGKVMPDDKNSGQVLVFSNFED